MDVSAKFANVGGRFSSTAMPRGRPEIVRFPKIRRDPMTFNLGTLRHAFALCGVLLAGACIGSVDDMNDDLEGSEQGATAVTGNGAPSGHEFQLNLIGVPKGKSTDTSNNGRRIFIPLAGTTKILLQEGDFAVID